VPNQKVVETLNFSKEEYDLKRLDEWDKEHFEKADKDKPKYYDE